MLYRKEEVIKLGNKEISRFKKLWFGFGVGFLLWTISVILGYLLLESMRKELTVLGLIFVLIMLFGLGVYCIIYSLTKKYDPLLEGCKKLRRKSEGVCNLYNAKSKSDAKEKYKRTGESVVYPTLLPKFEYQELYKLLTNKEEAEYLSYSEDLKKSSDVILKKENKK